MKCPNCGSMNYSCMETRHDGDTRVRRYVCNSCEYRFKTEENVVGMKHPDSPRYTPVGVGVKVDGRAILNSLRKPMSEMRTILRSYDELLK